MRGSPKYEKGDYAIALKTKKSGSYNGTTIKEGTLCKISSFVSWYNNKTNGCNLRKVNDTGGMVGNPVWYLFTEMQPATRDMYLKKLKKEKQLLQAKIDTIENQIEFVSKYNDKAEFIASKALEHLNPDGSVNKSLLAKAIRDVENSNVKELKTLSKIFP
jgi:hypothetical protein